MAGPSVGDKIAGVFDGEFIRGEIIGVDKGKYLIRTESDHLATWDGGDGVEVTEKADKSPKPINDERVSEMVTRYERMINEAQDLKEKAEAILEDSKGLLYQIRDQMDIEQIRSFKFVDGDGEERTCYRQSKWHPRVKDTEAFLAWVWAYGLDPKVFTTTAINTNKMKAFCRSRNESQLSIPDGVEVFEDEELAFRPSFKNRKKK